MRNLWLDIKYVSFCHFGWNCNRNFTSTYGCVHCGRTGYETWKGRRYYGAEVCKQVRLEMMRNRDR